MPVILEFTPGPRRNLMLMTSSETIFAGERGSVLIPEIRGLTGVDPRSQFRDEILEIFVTNQSNQFRKVAGRVTRHIRDALGIEVEANLSHLQKRHDTSHHHGRRHSAGAHAS